MQMNQSQTQAKPIGKTLAPLVAVLAIALMMMFSGCAATHTAIAHKDLDVQTRMSESIFLDPVAKSKRTIFLSVRNTSDKTFDIEDDLKNAFLAKGYKVFDDPDRAHYMLQVQVLQVSKASPTAAESALYAGYGGPLAKRSPGPQSRTSPIWP